MQNASYSIELPVIPRADGAEEQPRRHSAPGSVPMGGKPMSVDGSDLPARGRLGSGSDSGGGPSRIQGVVSPFDGAMSSRARSNDDPLPRQPQPSAGLHKRARGEGDLASSEREQKRAGQVRETIRTSCSCFVHFDDVSLWLSQNAGGQRGNAVGGSAAQARGGERRA